MQEAPAANVPLSLRMVNLLGFHSQLPDISFVHDVRTDADGKFAFPKCIAGEWERIVSYDEALSSTNPRHRAYEKREKVALLPGQQQIDVIGKDGADLIGRVVFPNDSAVAKTDSRVYTWKNADDGTNRRHREFPQHSISLKPDGSFRLYNLSPGTHEIEISILVAGEANPRPGYSKRMIVTPNMFAGKSPTNPVDLGEIQVEPVK
jgi:hypothetical protein